MDIVHRKIKVVIPNAGMTRETLNMREEMLSAYLDPTTRVSVDCITHGPEAIESQTDELLAGPAVLKQAIAAESDGFNAYVVYCFSDPGVEACRELLSIPVIGPGESSLAIAGMLGRKIGIITTRLDNISRTKARITKSIYGNALCSVRSLDIDVLALRTNERETIKALRNACRLCVEADGAEVIILGCLGMASYGEVVSDEIGVPVIDPAFIALSTAETMIKLGMKHNKRDLPIVSASTLKLLRD